MGMSNFEAIQSTTMLADELLGVDKNTGRIEKGYDADLILLPGNPLQEIRYLQDALLVMSNGQLALKRISFGK